MKTNPSFRRTKIVSTLGPASSSLATIRALLESGVDAVRLNFSHGDHATHHRMVALVRRASREVGKPVPIIQDLQGPRLRLGLIPGDSMNLKKGSRLTVTSGSSGRARGVGAGTLSVSPAISFQGMRRGHRVLIGDGGVVLKITAAKPREIGCVVARGGSIRSRQGVNLPDGKAALPSLTAKDVSDLKFGLAEGVDFVALSFVRSAADIHALRRHLDGTGIGVIAKIETQEALCEIDKILEATDVILVARGDLASEVTISEVPIVQKFLIEQSNLQAKPVITATQMLESMMTNPQPTRAEASDVANAVLDGSDAVMLSGETAMGKYPVETVRTMRSIVTSAETAHAQAWIRPKPTLEPAPHIDETIAYLAASAAHNLSAAAIITFTISGSTALRVAKFRPLVPIVAVTPSAQTMMRLGLSYGTTCVRIGKVRDTDTMIRTAIEAAHGRGIVKKGDLVVVTAGVPVYRKGTTNLVKLEVVP
jgi:pyruvate kinase